MKARLKETRDKSVEDLQREITDKQRHLFDLRSQAVTEKLEDPTQLGKTKRYIAQVKTILREREIAAQPPKAEAAPKAPKVKQRRPKQTKVARQAVVRIRAPKKGSKAAAAAAGGNGAETK
jgi:large subunit ribosomal protein L29